MAATSNAAVTALARAVSARHGNGVENTVQRVRDTAARAAAYEASAPPQRMGRRRGAPCAVVALAREDGCSYELVRKLLAAHRRIPSDLLEALRPHWPSITCLGELSRLSEERQRRVVQRVIAGEMRLGLALRVEMDT